MNPTFCFKRWSRKRYAVFASLHRIVKIGVVTFTCTLVQERYQAVFAQSDTLTHSKESTDLEEVEVTAGQPLPWTALPIAVSTLTQKDIAAAPAAGIEDILEHLPGLDIRQRGPDGVQADIHLNGGSFDQVLILLNGVNITDPQTGHYNLDVPIDLSQLKRVEVLRGASAGMLGSNAFAGAINLITTSSAHQKGIKGRVEVVGGSWNRRQGGATVSFGSHRFNLEGSFSTKSSDGYAANTDYTLSNAHLQTGYEHPTWGLFFAQLGYQQKAFGANSFYSLSYPNQFEATTTLFAALKWDKAVGRSYIQAQVYERRHHDRFELFRDRVGAASWYTGHNYHLTDVPGARVTVTNAGKTRYRLIGLEWRNERILSTVLGEPLSKGVTDPFDETVTFNKFKQRSTVSGVVNQRWLIGPVATSLGVTVNYTPHTGFYWQGGVDGRYQLKDGSTATINLNRSIRLPSFTDLYYQSATQRSNPALQPEQAVTLEGRFEKRLPSHRLLAGVWHRWGENLIDWIRYPDSTKWESSNLTSLEATGATLEAVWYPKQGHLTTVSLNYSFLYQNKTAEGFDSKYALDYLKHKVDVKVQGWLIRHPRYGTVSLQVDGGYFNRSGSYTDTVVAALVPYQPYWQWNTRLNWLINHVNVFIDLNNLTNQTQPDIGGLIQPGRNVRTGLTYFF